MQKSIIHETEKAVEVCLRERMKAVGGKAFKFVSPGSVGVPDRICIFPGGKIIFVELKGTGGRLSKLQENRLAELEDLGCKTAVLYSKHEVMEFVVREV